MAQDSYLQQSLYKKHSNLDTDNTNFEQSFTIPNWGIKDYIRERAIWQKGVESLAGEPGWFYFKIFFKFNTNYGLFGGILDDTRSINTAIEYLKNCENSYEVSQIAEREIALLKFVGSLSYINENAPWFFNSISGLNKANSIKLSEPFKQNEIEIGIREDAVDMRLTTLFELYKYACFDNINLKEIIPENLRMFDMTILVFHTPLRYYQTGFQSMKNGTYQYKSFNSNNYGDRMSYMMFTFTNCEFDLESIGNVVPTEMSNETAFNIGKTNIKIKYKRVYKHTSNEWSQMFFGDGSKFENNKDRPNKYNTQSNRIDAIKNAVDNSGYYNKTADIYKPLVDAVEKEANDIMRTVDPETALGNLYWSNIYEQSRQERVNNENSSIFGKIKNKIDKIKSTFSTIAHGSSLGVGSRYFKSQLHSLKNGDETLRSGTNPYMPGTKYFNERLKEEKSGDKSLRSGINPYMPGTPYFVERLKEEKSGDESLHDKKTNPYMPGTKYFNERLKEEKSGDKSLRSGTNPYMPGTKYFNERLKEEKSGDKSLRSGTNPYMPGTKYFNERLKEEKSGDKSLHDKKTNPYMPGTPYFAERVKNEKSGDENLRGDNPYMPGTKYFNERLKEEKSGDKSLHDKKTNPYMPGTPYFAERVKNEKSGDENLRGDNPYMPGTKYFNERLKEEKSGDKSLHDKKTNPYMPGTPYFAERVKNEKSGDENLRGDNPYMPGTPYFTERVKKEKEGDPSLRNNQAEN